MSEIRGFGGGSGDVFLDNVERNGTEQQLTECEYNGIGIDQCKKSTMSKMLVSPAFQVTCAEQSVTHTRH